MSLDTVLDTEIYEGKPDEPGILNATNGQVNWLTEQLAAVGSNAAILAAIEAARAADREVAQGITEWWWLPNALYLDEPYRHTLATALGNSDSASPGWANVLLVDYNHETDTITTHVVGAVPNDDHSLGAAFTKPGKPILHLVNRHGADTLQRCKVGLPDRPETVVSAPEQTFNVGGTTSYGQLWPDDGESDAVTMAVQCLYRRDLVDWYVLQLDTDLGTRAVTSPNSPGVHLFHDDLQCYLTSAAGSEDGQILRVIAGTSPASEPDWVLGFEINLATGAITSPFDEDFTANLDGTNLPITKANGPQFLPSLSGAKAGYERRNLAVRGWPAPFGVVTAEADPNDRPGTAHYWLHEWDGAFSGVTEGDHAPADGLIIPNGGTGYAKTTEVALANGAASIKVTARIKLPPTKPADDWLAICGQLDDASSTSGWQLWLGATVNELKPRLIINRVGNSAQSLTSAAVLSGITWGGECYLRSTYTVAAVGGIRITFESSPDGVTWTTISTAAGNAGALVVSGDAYTWVGARAKELADGLAIRTCKIEVGGVVETDQDFSTNTGAGWDAYAPTNVDGQANHWSLIGSAYVGRVASGPVIPPAPIPVSHDLGLVGPYLWASYAPGAAPNGDTILLARTVGGAQQLVASYVDASGTVHETILRTQPTATGKFFRPMVPRHGGPLWCLIASATSYGTDEFRAWAAKLLGIKRR